MFLSVVVCQRLCRQQGVFDYASMSEIVMQVVFDYCGMSEIMMSLGCFSVWWYLRDCDVIRVFFSGMSELETSSGCF